MKIRVRLPDGSTLKLNVEGTTTYGELLDMSGGSGNYLSLNKREPLTHDRATSPLTSPQYGTRTMRRARWGRDTGGDVATIVLDRPAMRRAR